MHQVTGSRVAIFGTGLEVAGKLHSAPCATGSVLAFLDNVRQASAPGPAGLPALFVVRQRRRGTGYFGGCATGNQNGH